MKTAFLLMYLNRPSETTKYWLLPRKAFSLLHEYPVLSRLDVLTLVPCTPSRKLKTVSTPLHFLPALPLLTTNGTEGLATAVQPGVPPSIADLVVLFGFGLLC